MPKLKDYVIQKTPSKLGMQFYHIVSTKTGQPVKDKRGLVVVSSSNDMITGYLSGMLREGLA